MHKTESTYHSKNQSDTTGAKESVNQLPALSQKSSPSNEKNQDMENSLQNKLNRSLESSINMLEKCIEGIDGGKDSDGEDLIVLDNIDAAHKLIDMAVKIVAVRERLKV